MFTELFVITFLAFVRIELGHCDTRSDELEVVENGLLLDILHADLLTEIYSSQATSTILDKVVPEVRFNISVHDVVGDVYLQLNRTYLSFPAGDPVLKVDLVNVHPINETDQPYNIVDINYALAGFRFAYMGNLTIGGYRLQIQEMVIKLWSISFNETNICYPPDPPEVVYSEPLDGCSTDKLVAKYLNLEVTLLNAKYLSKPLTQILVKEFSTEFKVQFEEFVKNLYPIYKNTGAKNNIDDMVRSNDYKL
ncbi:hypothetical protein HDE_14169 [Halotydeus destructor]|nr:hypothetical protein HDE_14169 [Halotydeus destructor]